MSINSSLNESLTVCNDNKFSLNKQKSPKIKISNESIILNKNHIQKLNTSSLIKYIPNTFIKTSINNSWFTSTDNDKSAFKSHETLKSPPPELRVL